MIVDMNGKQIFIGQVITDCIESFLVINTTNSSARCQSLYDDQIYEFVDYELNNLFEIEVE